jgi:hypothetical protein
MKTTTKKRAGKPSGKGRPVVSVRPQRLPRAAPITGEVSPVELLARDAVISLRLADFAIPVGARATSLMPAPSVVRRDLLRYYEMLDVVSEALRVRLGALDPAWLAKLRLACDGVSFSSDKQVGMLWAFASMAFPERDAEAAALFKGLSLAELYAVVDLLESERAGPLVVREGEGVGMLYTPRDAAWYATRVEGEVCDG